MAGSGAQWSTFLTKAVFEKFFLSTPPRNAFYAYEAFVKAAKGFPAFGRTGTKLETRKRELTAFLAQVHHETEGLKHIKEQISMAKAIDDYCTPSTRYPCAPRTTYQGRGPLQLSHNFDYGAFGDDFNPKQNLLENPERVATTNVLAFKAAVWFWMRGRHHYIIKNPPSFGDTIRCINGGKECGDRPGINKALVENRVKKYEEICKHLGISPGPNLRC